MDLLLDALRNLPEYETIRSTLRKNRHVGVSGAAQINRSHLIAGLARDLGAPLLVICQDDLAARRTQEELTAFLGKEYPILPGRDLTFYDTSAASRQWEQRRLRTLWAFANRETELLLTTWEALSLRTLPKSALRAAAVELARGEEYDLEALCAGLLRAGYTRCQMVEGVGQFALRGGILDVYSPAMDAPVRAEFFGDELDAMGAFDPLTQRRTDNLERAVLLPVAETLPALHPEGMEGLREDISRLLARQKRRKVKNEGLIKTLETDLEKIENQSFFGAYDRYMSLIYPEFTTAADYVPADGVLVFCDHGNLRRAAAARVEDMGLQLDSLLQGGILAGELCDFVKDWEQECEELQAHPALFLDAFLAAAYPECMQPAALLDVVAKQLPSYGGNLEIAATDLTHYRKNGYRTLVLCGNRRRGELLEEFLREKNVPVTMAFPAEKLPEPGTVYLTDGSLPAGMEYPTLKLAVLSEGQLLAKTTRRAPKTKVKATRSKPPTGRS